METSQITSESVTEGHPDKLCDQISDHILDEYLRQDPDSRVAIECMISKNLLVIAGEVKSKAIVSIEEIARNTIVSVGYDNAVKGMNGHQCIIVKNINEQSADINQGVDIESRFCKKIGAGDQGVMYGFACNETASYLPLTVDLAHKLAKRLSEVRKNGTLSYLNPDGKTQVTVEYDEFNRPIGIKNITISAQHKDGVDQHKLIEDIVQNVIKPVIPKGLLKQSTSLLINPTGRFVIGGPLGDTGLTGRKIMVDTYGGIIPHGGGAFSGKDASKVDRTGAYMCRYVAKNIVAAGLADRCNISLTYTIGVENPTSIYLNTFDTEKVNKKLLYVMIKYIFDFSVKGMIESLNLKEPIFSKTSVYGHFKDNHNLPWERVDKANSLKAYVSQLYEKIGSA
ncbi:MULTISPECIES: methionine adenosyltransferase [Virgibacillus]|uniref:methionine adenosyltransferase n=1 Tax=Virgibacillus TaxID=84406 RepID=UPI000909CF0B|nr:MULTISPECIES: methionine adenosyltransferase [Virgibacillus]API92859.1 methionine adenosyltransferase [Virgibacillus sp. 6R]MBS7428371.1 methionine adenosyltransferase [Virgibacillus sp. 19R1-5]MBU8565195.1 methionine adenosyltransferase [Virgibacillus pantothenticus]MBU8601479.1 methionine adenosyltransferase [Virgibacillus pantothenticus]MBU8633514.1 methionine adenosyltransferase [Virgibacillus pantothenticus]